MDTDHITILKSLGFKIHTKESSFGGTYTSKRIVIEPPNPPDSITPSNCYVKVTKTATKGTIGRVIDVQRDYLSEWCGTYIIEIDGRKAPSKVNSCHCTLLKNYTGGTVWVRNVRPASEKPAIKTPINKYKQELHKEDWVVGMSRKRLVIGQVTRWTNFTIWVIPHGASIDDKTKEIKLDDISETFLMPDTDHVKSLTWAAIKGWNGK